jgi:hypothetical protein
MPNLAEGKEWVIYRAQRLAEELNLRGEFEWGRLDEDLRYPLKFKKDEVQQGPLIRITQDILLWCVSEPQIRDRLTNELLSWLQEISAQK